MPNRLWGLMLRAVHLKPISGMPDNSLIVNYS